MRSIILVAYDIRDDKQRTQVFKKLKGYGEALQYSLFRCVLTAQDRARLRAELWGLFNHGCDRILLIDLGPEDGRGHTALETWGCALVDPAGHDGVLIV